MKDFVRAIPMATFDSATLTGAYDPIWATGLPEACFLIRVINLSNVAVGVSYDGVNTHEYLGAAERYDINFQTNSQPNNKVALLAKGSNVCLIGQAGQGDIYFIGYYQET